MVRKAILIPSSAPKPKSICSMQAARNVFFLLSHILLSRSHPCAVYLRRDCSCLQPMTQTSVFLSGSSPPPSVLSAAPLDPVRAGGRRRESLLFAEWALGPNGNLCLLQQSNPEAGGILNRAERASPVLLGTPSPPCQHTPEQVGAPTPLPNSPRSPSNLPLLFRSGGFPLASSGFPHPSSPTAPRSPGRWEPRNSGVSERSEPLHPPAPFLHFPQASLFSS